MPKRLIELYSAKRSEEIAEFKKALKREQARAKLKGGELANLDVEQITLVAAGSEILPPPTPEPPAPEPVAGNSCGSARNCRGGTIAYRLKLR